MVKYLICFFSSFKQDFVSNVVLELDEIMELLLEAKVKGSMLDTACRWVRDNRERWEEWIASETSCTDGYGLVSLNGAFVRNRSQAWVKNRANAMNYKNWVVFSNSFCFHPYLGKIPILTNIFGRGWNHQLEKNLWPLTGFWKKKLFTLNLFFQIISAKRRIWIWVLVKCHMILKMYLLIANRSASVVEIGASPPKIVSTASSCIITPRGVKLSALRSWSFFRSFCGCCWEDSSLFAMFPWLQSGTKFLHCLWALWQRIYSRSARQHWMPTLWGWILSELVGGNFLHSMLDWENNAIIGRQSAWCLCVRSKLHWRWVEDVSSMWWGPFLPFGQHFARFDG